MRQGGGFRALAALLLLGVIAFITAGAYGIGYTAGQSSGTTTNLAPWAYGSAFGAGHLVGFIVTIIVLVIMFRLLALVFFGHRRRYWGHPGYWHSEGDQGQFGPGAGGPGGPGGPGFGPGGPGFGPGGWHRSEWRQAGQAAFDEFHRQAHTNQPPTGGETPGSTPGTPGADQPR